MTDYIFPSNNQPIDFFSSHPAMDRGVILVDHPVKDIPWETRRSVGEIYGRQVPSEYHMYIVAAKLPNGDDLILPKAYGRCDVVQKPTPGHKPGPNHVNHPTLTAILAGDNYE